MSSTVLRLLTLVTVLFIVDQVHSDVVPWDSACPGCILSKRIVGFNIQAGQFVDNIDICLHMCNDYADCKSIEYNTKGMCSMNSRKMDASDTEIKDGWVYCPRVGAVGGCENDGSCSQGKCICPDGFEGDHCETEVFCRDIVCENGGECIEDICVCPDGFYGELCETSGTEVEDNSDEADEEEDEDDDDDLKGKDKCGKKAGCEKCRKRRGKYRCKKCLSGFKRTKRGRCKSKDCKVKNCEKCFKGGKRCRICESGYKKANYKYKCVKGKESKRCPRGRRGKKCRKNKRKNKKN